MTRRLTIEEVDTLRRSSAPLPSGVAPTISSDLFKSQHGKDKPVANNVNHLFSREGRNILGSDLKKSAALQNSRNLIRLGVGRPNAIMYPWTFLEIGLSKSAQQATEIGKKDWQQQQQQRDQEDDDLYDLSTALNYGNSMGSPTLLRFLTEHMEIVHNPLYSNWGVCVTCGSTSSIQMAVRLFCNPGETVLVEGFTYPGFLEAAKAFEVNTRGVPVDLDGLCSTSLDLILSLWDTTTQGSKPRLLYMIPSGQNPTGRTLSISRKRAIYQVAEKHDLMIIEDDPYYFINLGSSQSSSSVQKVVANENKSIDDFLSSLDSSFLSIDGTGRVIRLDSTSKILSPGLRAGWVTANVQVIDKFAAYNELDAITASGPSQYMLYQLFEVKWGHRGFFQWLMMLSLQYCQRLEIMNKVLKHGLSSDLCHWSRAD